MNSCAEISPSPIIDSDVGYSVKECLAKELTIDTHDEENKDKDPENRDKDSVFVISDKIVSQLTHGLLSHHVEDLKKMACNLREINKNQEVAIETLQQENTRFIETLKMYNLDEVCSRAKLYNTKLQHIKKEMTLAHEKSVKLKKRALKLQQLKQKEALHKELQRDQEIERDKQLAPKLVTNS